MTTGLDSFTIVTRRSTLSPLTSSIHSRPHTVHGRTLIQLYTGTTSPSTAHKPPPSARHPRSMNNQDASAQPTTLSSASTSTHTSSNGMTSSSSDTPSHATAVTSTTDTQRPEPEAGPSRPRSSSTRGDHHSHRPSSPETVFTSERPPSTPHLDLATYPTTTLLRLLANLLQQIAESNDSLRTELDDHVDDDDAQSMQSGSESRSSVQPHPSPTTALFHTLPGSHPHSTPVPSTFDEPLPLFTASKASLSHPSSLLSFHARHVPSISIEAYLLRILKYCPTTNEVFLGLLVYFDRMSRLGTASGVGGEATGARRGIGRGFAIDSYNVHRLVIAGVTVASKFFSGTCVPNPNCPRAHGQMSFTQTRDMPKSGVCRLTSSTSSSCSSSCSTTFDSSSRPMRCSGTATVCWATGRSKRRNAGPRRKRGEM